jgi:hypothetical protein
MRLSREDGDDLESESISNQRNILKDFASKNNLYMISEYIDDGFTGTNFNRPEFIKLIEDVREKRLILLSPTLEKKRLILLSPKICQDSEETTLKSEIMLRNSFRISSPKLSWLGLE